ncbi:hypothetical protein HK102_007423 [Quaeritorhiza haematococci]|nr:hypothetical protein HK102_007423 [Quaeritorhiza haematococci]
MLVLAPVTVPALSLFGLAGDSSSDIDIRDRDEVVDSQEESSDLETSGQMSGGTKGSLMMEEEEVVLESRAQISAQDKGKGKAYESPSTSANLYPSLDSMNSKDPSRMTFGVGSGASTTFGTFGVSKSVSAFASRSTLSFMNPGPASSSFSFTATPLPKQQNLSSKQTPSPVKLANETLADFFSRKGDHPLTPEEAKRCIQLVQQSVSASTSATATPAALDTPLKLSDLGDSKQGQSQNQFQFRPLFTPVRSFASMQSPFGAPIFGSASAPSSVAATRSTSVARASIASSQASKVRVRRRPVQYFGAGFGMSSMPYRRKQKFESTTSTNGVASTGSVGSGSTSSTAAVVFKEPAIPARFSTAKKVRRDEPMEDVEMVVDAPAPSSKKPSPGKKPEGKKSVVARTILDALEEMEPPPTKPLMPFGGDAFPSPNPYEKSLLPKIVHQLPPSTPATPSSAAAKSALAMKVSQVKESVAAKVVQQQQQQLGPSTPAKSVKWGAVTPAVSAKKVRNSTAESGKGKSPVGKSESKPATSASFSFGGTTTTASAEKKMTEKPPVPAFSFGGASTATTSTAAVDTRKTGQQPTKPTNSFGFPSSSSSSPDAMDVDKSQKKAPLQTTATSAVATFPKPSPEASAKMTTSAFQFGGPSANSGSSSILQRLGKPTATADTTPAKSRADIFSSAKSLPASSLSTTFDSAFAKAAQIKTDLSKATESAAFKAIADSIKAEPVSSLAVFAFDSIKLPSFAPRSESGLKLRGAESVQTTSTSATSPMTGITGTKGFAFSVPEKKDSEVPKTDSAVIKDPGFFSKPAGTASSSIKSSDFFAIPPKKDAAATTNPASSETSTSAQPPPPKFNFNFRKPADTASKSDTANEKSVTTPASGGFNWAAAGIQKPTAPEGSWKCSVCMITNKNEVDKCAACETDRPGKAPAALKLSFGGMGSSATPVSGSGAAATTGVGGDAKAPAAFDWAAAGMKIPEKAPGSWTCAVCAVTNQPDALKCIACETDRPGGGAAGGSKYTSTGGATPAVTFGGFKAPAVSFGGIPASAGSAAASTTVSAKTVDTTKPSTTSTTGGFNWAAAGMAKPTAPEGSWKCSVCMITNKNELHKCAACESDRPGGSGASATGSDKGASKPSVTFGGSKAPAVSFGGTPAAAGCAGAATSSDSKPAATTATFDWAAAGMQKPVQPAGTWTCSVCAVPNKPEADKCCACETDRPGAKKAAGTGAGSGAGGGSTAKPTVTFGSSSSSLSGATRFSFGGATPAGTGANTGFKFGGMTPGSGTGGFSFGGIPASNGDGKKDEGKSKEGATDKEKPAASTPAPMKFGGFAGIGAASSEGKESGKTKTEEQREKKNTPMPTFGGSSAVGFSFGGISSASASQGVAKTSGEEKAAATPSFGSSAFGFGASSGAATTSGSLASFGASGDGSLMKKGVFNFGLPKTSSTTATSTPSALSAFGSPAASKSGSTGSLSSSSPLPKPAFSAFGSTTPSATSSTSPSTSATTSQQANTPSRFPGGKITFGSGSPGSIVPSTGFSFGTSPADNTTSLFGSSANTSVGFSFLKPPGSSTGGQDGNAKEKGQDGEASK